MSVIDLDHASICVHGRTVLSDITISIGQGEFIGVLGPNGSGKTTLMRTLLGLLEPANAAWSVRAKSRHRPGIWPSSNAW